MGYPQASRQPPVAMQRPVMRLSDDKRNPWPGNSASVLRCATLCRICFPVIRNLLSIEHLSAFIPKEEWYRRRPEEQRQVG